MKTLLYQIKYPKFISHVAITNNKTAKNKYVKINANLIYSGNLHPQSRKVAVHNMKKFLRDSFDFTNIKIKDFPIQIETIVRIPINYGDVRRKSNGEISYKEAKPDYEPKWDVGNYGYLWSKIFLDLLQEKNTTDTDDVIRLGIIPNDCVKYVKTEGPFDWEQCDSFEERELIFNIYKLN